MNTQIIPNKLNPGDTIQVIAPARSLSVVRSEVIKAAEKALSRLGLNVSFSMHCNESDLFNSSLIESRIEDLHNAFLDPNIKGIFSVIGGFNSNQILKYIDYDLIKRNPKVFCGFSDITALCNTIYAKTGMITYSGPHFSSFAMEKGFEYTLKHFQEMIMGDGVTSVEPSKEWSDDPWYRDQENRNFIKNEGFWIINEGEANGTILGGNLGTFCLLNGTEYQPDFANSVLLIEDDACTDGCDDVMFERFLQSLIHQPGFDQVKGIVIGRFQIASEVSKKMIEYMVKTKRELDNIPVIANVDFGHTTPFLTLPIGGNIAMLVNKGSIKIRISE